jgi:hypothetical protein
VSCETFGAREVGRKRPCAFPFQLICFVFDCRYTPFFTFFLFCRLVFSVCVAKKFAFARIFHFSKDYSLLDREVLFKYFGNSVSATTVDVPFSPKFFFFPSSRKEFCESL